MLVFGEARSHEHESDEFAPEEKSDILSDE